MKSWSAILDNVASRLDATDVLFFRGQSQSAWTLMPGLGRLGLSDPWNREATLYYDFLNQSGPLLPEDRNSWRTIFLMQHHGLPTRFLDWSDTFSTALYFAIKNANGSKEAAVWILDPYELNSAVTNSKVILSPSELSGTYEEYFIWGEKKFQEAAIALSPSRHHPRLFNQRGCFTLHADLTKGLESICPSAVEKIAIPNSFFPQAKRFLTLAGVNEFSLFPDLDGLARHLKMQ